MNLPTKPEQQLFPNARALFIEFLDCLSVPDTSCTLTYVRVLAWIIH